MKAALTPLKVKDTESVSWSKALASYLKRSYGSSTWSQFFDAKLAEDMDILRGNANGTLAAEALLEQNLLYYAFLEQLNLRLGNNSTQLKLEFTWYDAGYTPQSATQKYTQRTVAFEKSSVLYNIGAIMTQAAKEKVESDSKASINYMSKAFGVFQFLSENFLNSPSVDLQAENTSFLADLCHAEAQELFLLKIINGPDATKHSSLIAKLALMLSSIYEKIESFYTASNNDKPESHYGEYKWKGIIMCKVHLYKSISAFNHGLALEQQSKFGEAIAFLQIANDAIVSALTHKLSVKDNIDLEAVKTLITDKEKALVKDNDFIYHHTVPTTTSLESIKSMDAIKMQTLSQQIAPYMEKVSESAGLLFKGIIPLEVYEKESIYSEQKAALMRKELEVSDTADWEYNSFIEFTTLPKLLQDLTETYANGGKRGLGDNPQVAMMREQLLAWSTTVQGSPFKNVGLQMRSIVDKRKEILGLLSSSSSENKENIVKLKSSLLAASQSDQKLFSFVEPHLKEIDLLGKPEALQSKWAELTAASSQEPNLLDLDDSKNDEILSKIRYVSEQYENLKVLKDERSRIVQDLKKSVGEDDITKAIIMNRGMSEAEMKILFQKELDKFKPLSTRIEATIFRQRSIINAIKLSLDEVFKLTGVDENASKTDPNMQRRNEFYKKLNEAFSNFSIFANDLPKGLSFYDSLLKMARDMQQPASGLQEDTPSHSFSYSGQIEQNFSKLNISPAPMEGRSAPTPSVGNPAIPPRTYPGSYQAFSSTDPSIPPIPPKQPPSGISGLMGRNTDFDNQNMNQNPTSFYNNPSVFDESLYSRYST